jgi:hypothetical protein
MVLFKSSEDILCIAFVQNEPQNPTRDKMFIFKILDSAVEQFKELVLSSKVNSICVGASIQHSGYETSK